MKRKLISMAMLIMIGLSGIVMMAKAESPGVPQETLEVIYSPDMKQVADACIRSFSDGHPGILVHAVEADLSALDEQIKKEGNIALVTKQYLRDLSPGSVAPVVVGREVFIPVMHPDNPCREEIRARGISTLEFARAYAKDGKITWGALMENNCTDNVHAYRIQDPAFMNYLSGFTGKKGEQFGGRVMEKCSDVMDAVRSDPGAIGFCTLTQLLALEESGGTAGLEMVPVDINDNNRLDHFEQLYGSVDELVRGIWIGKYPASLYSRIYLVNARTPSTGAEELFTRWMITDGQQYLVANGYSGLLENEQETMLAALDAPSVAVAMESERSGNALLLIIGAVLIGGVLTILVFRGLNRKAVLSGMNIEINKAVKGTGVENAPGGYFMDRSHTWSFMERNGLVRIGIDPFLRHITGVITRVNLKNPGDEVKRGEPFMSLVQQGKTMEVHAPINGKIAEVNTRLEKSADLISTDPLSDGWVYTIEPAHWMKELPSMFQGERYREWIRSEVSRLKDFMASGIRKASEGATEPVLQDGGELREGILEQLGPEAWEDFQTGFLHK